MVFLRQSPSFTNASLKSNFSLVSKELSCNTYFFDVAIKFSYCIEDVGYWRKALNQNWKGGS